MSKPKKVVSNNTLVRHSEKSSKSAITDGSTVLKKPLERNTEKPDLASSIFYNESKTTLKKAIGRTSSKCTVFTDESKASFKKSTEKKTLVRNTEKPIPKSVVVIDESKGCIKKTFTEKKPEKPVKIRNVVDETNLDLPELYSTLKISKRIDEIVKPRKTKSSSAIDKKLAVDDKATKQVNFPYDKSIYKDLVPLTSTSVKSQPRPARNPLPKKDPEPVLSDYITPRESPQYCYIPEIKLEVPPVIIDNDSLRLYKLLETFEKDKDFMF